jgi:hypothetical protein
MAEFNFPPSPANGDTYSLNGITYVYDSTEGAWKVATNLNTTELDADLASKKLAVAYAIALGG